MTVVKTFNDAQIKKLIKEADPELRKYIEAQKKVIENHPHIVSKAIVRLKELSVDKHKAEMKVEELHNKLMKWSDQMVDELALKDTKFNKLQELFRRHWNIWGLSHEKSCDAWKDDRLNCNCIVDEADKYFELKE